MRLALSLAALLAALPAIADDAHHHGTAPAAAATAEAGLSEGTVKKVDKAAGKLTIDHGPLANLDMPAMTMIFKAGDPAMLEKVKAGDKIRFLAERRGGVFVVKTLEPAK